MIRRDGGAADLDFTKQGNALRQQNGTDQVRAIDLFCGVGGTSCGASAAGVKLVAGFDMWSLAGEVFQDNFPGATFFSGKLEDADPSAIAAQLGRIDLIIASPECTNHSPARGGRKKSESSRNTAFQVIRFAKALHPRWIIIENVVSMAKWHRYAELIDGIESLGYFVRQQVLNTAEFGVPQSRRRLFVVCCYGHEPPQIAAPKNVARKTARDILDHNGHFEFSPLFSSNRAAATKKRARKAIKEIGSKKRQFLLVYYGTDGGGGWQTVDSPLRTITTIDRFALVRPSSKGYQMRMLQVPELKLAMGFPRRFRLDHGTRRDKIRMLGNAVCPPVAEAIVKSLLRHRVSAEHVLTKFGNSAGLRDFREKLMAWGKSHFRPFPWRATRNPYKVLVAEVLLHRTQAIQVVPVYNELLEKCPDATALMAVSFSKLKKILAPIGLHWRVELLSEMARLLCTQFAARIPRELSSLLSLPGVSDYIARAVRCFAWNSREAVIDTNVVRIMGRIFGLKISQSSRRNWLFRDIADGLVDPVLPRNFNLALLDMAHAVCTARQPPKCRECPVSSWCSFARKGEAAGVVKLAGHA